MSNQTLPPKALPPPSKPTVPHIEATFEGDYYKGVVGAMEVHPFTETVKIPNSWLMRDDMHPAAVFKHKFAKKIMKKHPGYNDVRTVHLKETTDLPDGMTVEQELSWTADFNKLVALAKQHASKVRFIPLDPKEGTPLPGQVVGVKPEFYSDAPALRNAIRRCISEPQAFQREQEKISKGYEAKRDAMTMQEELDALYPDGF